MDAPLSITENFFFHEDDVVAGIPLV